MDKPLIAQRAPFALELEPGDYFWCSCGRSSRQPFCDGSHKDTSFTPMKFSVDERKKLALCGCKKTDNSPFCDGSHNALPE